MAKEKICGIYKITSPSGKIYIGQSVDIKSRFSLYRNLKSKGQTLLHRSFLKYGVENHKFEVIRLCSDKWLNAFEKWFIKYFNSFESANGLNLTDGGSNGRLSEETKRKQSLAAKGKPKSEEAKQKVREANLGKKASAETRLKMSISHTGKKVSDQMREKCRLTKIGDKNPMFGKPYPEEVKQKQRETNKRLGIRPPVNTGAKNFKSRPVLNTQNGIFYESATEAWLAFGKQSVAAFNNKLNGKFKNNTYFILI